MEVIKLPRESDLLKGLTVKVPTGCGNLYVTCNFNKEGKLYEVFIRGGKGGSCTLANAQSLAQFISLALRFGCTEDRAIRQLTGIECGKPVFHGEDENGRAITSCGDGVGYAMQQAIGIWRNEYARSES